MVISTEKGAEAGEARGVARSRRGELAVLARLCALPLPPPSHLGGVPALLSFVLWHVQGLSMASAQ